MAEPRPHNPSFWRLIPLLMLIAAASAFLLSGGRHYLTFASLADNRELLTDFVARAGPLAPLGFVGTYAVLTSLSIPGAIIMTLAGGLLFGPWLGATYSLTGATMGASVVFLAARAGLAGIAERAGTRVQRLKSGFRKNAFNYLLSLRLVPLFPFWLVNLVAGMSGMGLGSYVAATFVGMIPAALIYAGLGNGAGELIAAGKPPDLHQMSRPGIFFPLLGLALLALIPAVFRHWRERRQQAAQ